MIHTSFSDTISDTAQSLTHISLGTVLGKWIHLGSFFLTLTLWSLQERSGDGSEGINNTVCTCTSRAGPGQPFSSEGDNADREVNVIKSYLGVETRTHTPNCKPPRWLHSQMPRLAKHDSTFTLVWRLESTFSGVCSNSLVIWECHT